MSLFRFMLLASVLTFAGLPAWAQLYEITTGEVVHNRQTRTALKVQVDGSVETTRDFWQDYMKDTYKLRFKSGTLATLGLKGKRDELMAEQVGGVGISSRLVELYADFSALNDSTTEVAFFGGFGDKTYFEPTRTVSEFKGLRTILERYTQAARVNAYRVQVKEAENNVTAAEKEQDKLNRSIQSAQSNTAANLKRIEELTRQNQTNAQQMRQDSARLGTNAQLREAMRQRLVRRRERLATVGGK